MIRLIHLCVVVLGLSVPISAKACSMPPPEPIACFKYETPVACTQRSRAQFEREQNEFRILKSQYNAANQMRWWREATEVQLVEVIGNRGQRARSVRPISWLKGRGYARTLEITDKNHYDPCPPTRGPLGNSLRGDLFIVFVFPRPATLSFDYEQTALNDIAIPQLVATMDAYQRRASQNK
jgi:hypothetical protein